MFFNISWLQIKFIQKLFFPFAGAIMFQYFIKIVPTMFVPESGATLHTNQFSVTTHQKSASGSNAESGGMPGVFFSYELSPLMVKFTEKSKFVLYIDLIILRIIFYSLVLMGTWQQIFVQLLAEYLQ